MTKKRAVIYLPEQDHQKLRAKLILQGKTVSQWAREIIKEYLEKDEEKDEEKQKETNNLSKPLKNLSEFI